MPGAGLEHRLTKPRTPRTNGMVERFNGRIADVLRPHRFNSREDMEQTLLRYVALYNHQLPQSALKSSTPMQAMKQWYQTHPHLFHKRPYDRPGCDIYAHGAAAPEWCGFAAVRTRESGHQCALNKRGSFWRSRTPNGSAGRPRCNVPLGSTASSGAWLAQPKSSGAGTKTSGPGVVWACSWQHHSSLAQQAGGGESAAGQSGP